MVHFYVPKNLPLDDISKQIVIGLRNNAISEVLVNELDRLKKEYIKLSSNNTPKLFQLQKQEKEAQAKLDNDTNLFRNYKHDQNIVDDNSNNNNINTKNDTIKKTYNDLKNKMISQNNYLIEIQKIKNY